MRRVNAKFVPRLLSQEQKELRLSISLELRVLANSDSVLILRSLMTGDESWVYDYNLEKKMQSFHGRTPKSPQAEKARQSKSNTKAMLNVFFDIEGIDRAEFVARCTTVTRNTTKVC
jgi:hypothetical protein